MTKPRDTRSAADAAFATFRALLGDKSIVRLEDATMSEADTRAKLIDPVFKTVLGWREVEIRREAPVAKGYTDYVLGSDYSYLLIEAKRSVPRFQVSAPSKPRRLKLDGPHLLGNKKVRPVVEQAQSYASDLGVQFSLATNGSQYIVFRPYIPGRPWRAGTAIVFHDHHDIEENFAEFYSLLSRESIVSGSLVEAFEHLERTTTVLTSVLDNLPDADRELVRNRVWQQISRIMGPLLSDTAETLDAQLEVIRNCYVTTPLADQTDQNLDQLLRDEPRPFLQDAGVVDLKMGSGGKTAFSHKLEADVHAARRAAYILTGGVGSGKTTFLRRFAYIVDKEFVERYTVWLHIDFLPFGNVGSSDLPSDTRAYVYKAIRDDVSARFALQLTSTGEAIREMFRDEIHEARLTRFYGYDERSQEWLTGVNQLVEDLFKDDATFVTAALRHLQRSGRRVAIVLDNTDQLGEAFQESVFLLAQKLATDHGALCVVTLREEKFFAAYRRGIFDAFGDRRFHIGSPDLRQVLQRRLEYGREKFALLAKEPGSDISDDVLKRIDALLKALIHSTARRNANIVRMLASVSNGDMRYALDMFREFLSSGNTNVEKIIAIVERGGNYNLPFHEFAKSAILGTRRYYRSSLARVVNVFKQSDALGASHLTACRILARLLAAESTASPHGEGFLAVPTLLREYRESFGFADDLVQWSSELLRRNLVESEPPRAPDLRHADALRITAAGAYYWRYLVRSFAYVDLVLVDTPLSDQAVVRRLESMVDVSDLTVRFERVRAFLTYLQEREEEELANVAARGGQFLDPLVSQIREQIEAEIAVIAKKTGAPDLFGPDND